MKKFFKFMMVMAAGLALVACSEKKENMSITDQASIEYKEFKNQMEEKIDELSKKIDKLEKSKVA